MKKFLLIISFVYTITGTLLTGIASCVYGGDLHMATLYPTVLVTPATNIHVAGNFSWYSPSDVLKLNLNPASIAEINNVTPNNWTGPVSTAWENAGNWSYGVIPDGNTEVVISKGTVIVNSNAICKKLTILPGVNFRVNSGFILTITGTSKTSSSGIVFSGKTAVFMGNSITTGTYASDSAHRWTSLFCAAKGAIEENRGINGKTMQNNSSCPSTSPFDPTLIPTYNSTIHSSLFIALGLNDVGLNNAAFTATAFKTSYTAAIMHAINIKGWPAKKIILVNIFQPYSWTLYTTLPGCTVLVAADASRAALYNTKVSEVANENGCMLVDIYSAMTGLTSNYFYTDGLHPIDLGHALIANYLNSVL